MRNAIRKLTKIIIVLLFVVISSGQAFSDVFDEIAAGLIESYNKNDKLNIAFAGASDLQNENNSSFNEWLNNNVHSLVKLDLASNNIGVSGAKAIAEVIKHNKTLTEVRLLWNFMGADGAKAIAAVLKENDVIRYLYKIYKVLEKQALDEFVKAGEPS